MLQFEPAQVSRFLVSLGASGLPVTLALNKADLLPAAEIQERLDQVCVLCATSWHVSAQNSAAIAAFSCLHMVWLVPSADAVAVFCPTMLQEIRKPHAAIFLSTRTHIQCLHLISVLFFGADMRSGGSSCGEVVADVV